MDSVNISDHNIVTCPLVFGKAEPFIMIASVFAPGSIVKVPVVIALEPPQPDTGNSSKNFSQHCQLQYASVPNWEGFYSEMGRLPFLRCRNLSLIVPLYGFAVALLKTKFILGVLRRWSNAESNETYCDGSGNSSV